MKKNTAIYSATLGLFALLVAPVVALSAPAPAQADDQIGFPAEGPFNAPLCEGATDKDPTEAEDDVPDLTRVFGQRLDDYNNGQPVILYGTEGGNGGSVPNCVLRHTDSGPVVEWSYCTDRESLLCNTTDEDGRLTELNEIFGGLEYQDGNSKLTDEQSQVIAYLLNNDIDVDAPVPYDLAGEVTTGSNATSDERILRQMLVWCVSDRDYFNQKIPGHDELGNYKVGEWCDANIGDSAQADIVASLTDDPQLSLSADPTEVDAGDSANVTVETNIFGQAITLDLGGATATVAEGEATLDGDTLVVDYTGSETATVVLEVTSEDALTTDISASASVATLNDLRWAQSPGTAQDTPCQVYAMNSGTHSANAADATQVTFVEPTDEGGDEPTDEDSDESADNEGAVDSDEDSAVDTTDDTVGAEVNTGGTTTDSGAEMLWVAFIVIGVGAAVAAGVYARRQRQH